jgi:uncharacterized membrane protein
MNLQKNFKINKLKLILFFLFLIWFVLQLLSPLSLESNSVRDLSGTVGTIDNQNVLEKLSEPWKTVYRIGDMLCHQKVERSYFINGNQMPFCSRCTGIFLGLPLGLMLSMFLSNKIRLTNRMVIVILLLILPLGIDGTLQLFGLWESKNIIRITTGALTGIAAAIAISLIIDELKNVKLLKYE